MDLLKISKYFTEATLDLIARNAGIGDKHISYKFTDSDTKKGDSYLSDVFRMRVDGKNGEINLVIKSMPKTASRRKTFRSSEFFRNEINFYTKVLPAFERFQKSRDSINMFIEYPRCLASYCDGENDFVALEDIGFQGYKAPVRQNYTDIDACILILRLLGRFHAVSIAFKDQSPKEFENVINSVEETYYREDLKEWYCPFLKRAIAVANDAVTKTYPNTKYVEKTEKFLGEKLYDDMISLVETKTKFAVIGHGDCWRPNFLAKFDESGKPHKIKIIDFQLARYGSPVCDIMFFMYNSTSEDQRNKHYEQLIKEYHASASDLIRHLGSDPEKIFSYDGLKEELKSFGRFGCGFCIESLPLSMLDDDEVTDLDSVNFENSTLNDFWKIKNLEDIESAKRLASIFKHSIDNAYID